VIFPHIPRQKKAISEEQQFLFFIKLKRGDETWSDASFTSDRLPIVYLFVGFSYLSSAFDECTAPFAISTDCTGSKKIDAMSEEISHTHSSSIHLLRP
jgi:hypothetical protein